MLESLASVNYPLKIKDFSYCHECTSTPISSATRVATVIAATRRGWVIPTMNPPLQNPAECRN